jgi:hypothetical protein
MRFVVRLCAELFIPDCTALTDFFRFHAAAMGDSRRKPYGVADYTELKKKGETEFNDFLFDEAGRECLLDSVMDALEVNRRPKGCKFTLEIKPFWKGKPNHYHAELMVGKKKFKPDHKGHIIVRDDDGNVALEVGLYGPGENDVVPVGRHRASVVRIIDTAWPYH